MIAIIIFYWRHFLIKTEKKINLNGGRKKNSQSNYIFKKILGNENIFSRANLMNLSIQRKKLQKVISYLHSARRLLSPMHKD